jgi:hypothetical protein
MDSKVEDNTTDANTTLNTTNSSIDEPEDYSEEEMKKAEEYKVQGNECFKCKLKVINSAVD